MLYDYMILFVLKPSMTFSISHDHVIAGIVTVRSH